MKRRAFLKSAAVGTMAAPTYLARAAAPVLRFVPTANLASLDPIWSPAYVARNAGLLIWDMLYGVDTSCGPSARHIASLFVE